MAWQAALGAAAGSIASDAFNAWSAHESREAAENMYRHRYRIMVHDLKAAGLNPMLAYMKDAGTPPTTTPAHASGDLGAVINQARTSSAQSNLMKIQEQNVAAQTAVANATADKTKAEEMKIRAETPNAGLYSAKMESEAYSHRAHGAAADAMAATRNALRPAEILRANSEAEIARAGIQHALNLEAAEFTEWKRDFAVYLDDALKMAQATNQASQALSISQIMKLIDQFRAQYGKPSKPHLPRDWNRR